LSKGDRPLVPAVIVAVPGRGACPLATAYAWAKHFCASVAFFWDAVRAAVCPCVQFSRKPIGNSPVLNSKFCVEEEKINYGGSGSLPTSIEEKRTPKA